MPDLVSYFLSGSLGTELTNASTTGLLCAESPSFDLELLERLGLPTSLFPPLREPGDPAGDPGAELSARVGLRAPVQVTTVASHDTASAVIAVPARNGRFAYVSCGTWSLVGVELDHPVLTESARTAQFTNERGLDGTTRLLRNVMGLWLLSESQRSYEGSGSSTPLEVLDLAQPRGSAPSRGSSIPTIRAFSRPGTCRRGSPPPASNAASSRRDLRRRTPAASSTASPWPTAAASALPASSLAWRSSGSI